MSIFVERMLSQSKQEISAFLRGGGQMGQLTREYDWSEHALGEPQDWPQSLKTTLGIILNSKFPMFLWWGPEHFCFYNDAYRPSLGENGKHPSILGMPAIDAWPEIWGYIKPLLDRILAGGEGVFNEDMLVPIFRNGKMEDVYWTFSYSPVFDETASEAGVLVTCTETTAKVNSLVDISRAKDELEFAINAADLGTWDLDPVTNHFVGNERLKRWFGITSGENIPLELAIAVIAMKDRQRVLDAIQRAMTYGSGGNYDIEYAIAVPEKVGETYVRAVGKALFNQQQQPVRFSGILLDVTASKIYEADLKAINNELADANRNLITANQELAASREQLEKATSILELAIDAAAIGIWSADLNTRVLTVSDRARKIHGILPEKELTLADLLELALPEDRQEVSININRAIENGKPFYAEYMISPMDGSARKWLRLTGVVTFENGRPESIDGTVIDITEQKQDDLRKNDFIGMVSHELKTPLTSLNALLQVLHRKLKDSTDRFVPNALENANKQAKKMSAMINGFLNMSRLESSKIIIEKSRFDMEDVIEEIVGELKLTISTHQILFDRCQPGIVDADHDKIASVLSNLVSNAAKYSPNGQVIDINCTVADQKNVQVSVRDEGMGIKQSDIAHIFDRYYRVENQHTHNISGFGIGLYLSAEIIKQHDGQIWAESELGKGSTFYFSLPLSAS